jgi:hypothetical protein
LLGRLRDWLEPKADAHHPDGPIRTAIWLGNGRIAVAGTRERGFCCVNDRATGLKLIDTRSWHVRTLDNRVADIYRAGDTLLATGTIAEDHPTKSIGLLGFDANGNRLFRLFAGRAVVPWAIVGTRVYVFRTGDVGRKRPYLGVDARTGRVLGRRSLPDGVVTPDRQFPPYHGELWPPIPP